MFYLYSLIILTILCDSNINIIEPQTDVYKYVVCATSKASDQLAHTRSLIRAFASRLNILLTEHHLECLSLTGGSEARLSLHLSKCHIVGNHVAAQLFFFNTGPQNWDSLFPEQCAGTNQSPIHIDPKETQFDWRLKDLVIWYDPPSPNSTWIVENDINTYSGIYF